MISCLPREDKANAKAILTDKVLRGSLRTYVPPKDFKNSNAQPPSFFNQDMEKWSQKFDAQIKDREDYKKKYFAKLDVTPATVNLNLEDPHKVFQARGFHTSLGFVMGAQMSGASTGRASENPESEYKRVMERRRSR